MFLLPNSAVNASFHISPPGIYNISFRLSVKIYVRINKRIFSYIMVFCDALDDLIICSSKLILTGDQLILSYLARSIKQAGLFF